MLRVIRILIAVTVIVGASATALVGNAEVDDRPGGVPATLPFGHDDEYLLGTWIGTVTVAGVADAFDGGHISIERLAGERFGVTVGPFAAVRYPGTRLERIDRGLKFEVSLPGVETRLLVYTVQFDGGSMTGTITLVKYKLTQTSTLAFERITGGPLP